MINLIFPIFDKIDSWTATFLPFPVQNLFWGIIAGIFAFFVYWWLSNQATISDIKNEMKSIRKKMFDSSLDDKAEYNALAKKNLSLSFNLLGKIFTPAILSIIPVIIIALWYDANHSYVIPFNKEKVTVTAVPNNHNLDILPSVNMSIENDGSIVIQPLSKSDEIAVLGDTKQIYSGTPFIKPIPYITKKKWWNFILRSPVGYLSADSMIDVIFFNYPEKILFKKMPHFINGWELLFFVGIFITALPLRLIFKVR